LEHQFNLAEGIFLDKGKVEDAMEMYQEMHKWDQSIRVAEQRNHPELDNLKRNYFQWLIESGQEERAAELKEEDGDYVSAINLYLKGGLPSRAASLLITHELQSNNELTEKIANSLYKSGLYERAGSLYELMGRNEKALDSYKNGNNFRAAVELCRSVFPAEVVKLEEVIIKFNVEMGRLFSISKTS
jgi:intraflagellar transport protein 172